MKVHSKEKLLEVANSILNWKPQNYLNEATQLANTETAEFKEGLVIYFLQINNEDFNRAKEKLNSKDTKFKINPPLPNPTNPAQYDASGKKSFDLVKTAVKHLNGDALESKDKQFYFNGLSIAEHIRSNYGGPVEADRGKLFSSIRKHAVNLIQKEYEIRTEEDKWCPADIYIYNASTAGQNAAKTTSVNQGDGSLNSFFQITDKKTDEGILGISLKEAKAQAGKASSFKNVLIKKYNYPDAPGLPAILETIMKLFYNIRMVRETGETTGKSTTKTLNKDDYIDSIKYLVNTYNNVETLVSLGVDAGGIKKLQTSLENILKSEVGSTLLKSSSSKTGYDSKKIKDALIQRTKEKVKSEYEKKTNKKLKKDVDLKSIPVKAHILDQKKAAGIVDITTAIAGSVNKQLIDEYNKEKIGFVNLLTKQGFSSPKIEGEPLTSKIGLEIESAETLLKKARCYATAKWFMEGLDTETLQIPPAYKTIIKQKNAFVALTAFAIGMAGISPTFFKYKGNKTGGTPIVEPFWGNGFLNLEGDKSKMTIVDSPSNKGFKVTFETNVTLEDSPGSDIVGKYKVTLDFRYAGDQINIEVQELKGEH